MPSCADTAVRRHQRSTTTTTTDIATFLRLLEILFDLVVSGGKIGELHRNGDGFFAEILERYLQLLSRLQGCQLLGRDRDAGVATARLAGLDLQAGCLAVIDLDFGTIR